MSEARRVLRQMSKASSEVRSEKSRNLVKSSIYLEVRGEALETRRRWLLLQRWEARIRVLRVPEASSDEEGEVVGSACIRFLQKPRGESEAEGNVRSYDAFPEDTTLSEVRNSLGRSLETYRGAVLNTEVRY